MRNRNETLYRLNTTIDVEISSRKWDGGFDVWTERDTKRIGVKEQTVKRLSEHLAELTTVIDHWMGKFILKNKDYGERGSEVREIEIRDHVIVVRMYKPSKTSRPEPLSAMDWMMQDEFYRKEELHLNISVIKRRWEVLPKNLLEQCVKYFKKQRKLKLQ